MTQSRTIPNTLTIAGTDPSGGAGIQADIKTFSALGTYATSVITAVIAQNTCGVRAVTPVAAEMVRAQIDAVCEDIAIDAVKIGMIGDIDLARTVRDALQSYRPRWVVLDPVMVAKSGDILVDDEGIAAVREILVPSADLITPNLPEAAVLLDRPTPHNRTAMEALAGPLRDLGAGATLLKGGHLPGRECPDLLITAGDAIWLEGSRVDTANLHGTGCTLSSAIAARLAHGDALPDAVATAKAWLEAALTASSRLDVGQGQGPVHHFHAWW